MIENVNVKKLSPGVHFINCSTPNANLLRPMPNFWEAFLWRKSLALGHRVQTISIGCKNGLWNWPLKELLKSWALRCAPNIMELTPGIYFIKGFVPLGPTFPPCTQLLRSVLLAQKFSVGRETVYEIEPWVDGWKSADVDWLQKLIKTWFHVEEHQPHESRREEDFSNLEKWLFPVLQKRLRICLHRQKSNTQKMKKSITEGI